MCFVTFQDYLAMREGLLLPDKPVLPSGSKINPFPAPASRLRQLLKRPARSFRQFVNSVENLPSTPGAYILHGLDCTTHYVGGAHDLRKIVRPA
jgi:hypothetical protein